MLFILNVILLYCTVAAIQCDHYKYMDPKLLQTIVDQESQTRRAQHIIDSYYGSGRFQVYVNFDLFVDNKDSFRLKSGNNLTKVYIEASTGIAALWSFNYYMKKYLKHQIAWQVRNIKPTERLPYVDEFIVSNDRFRYYQNVCTVSYSFLYWDVSKWSEHIQWMAMNGINLSLTPYGHEAVWERVYRSYNLTDDEMQEHWTGPAFLSWLRMGNVRGWGGPLSQRWHRRTLHLQHHIIRYMLELGMIPVLPGFSGIVPVSFRRIYPSVKFHKVGAWNSFEEDYCCQLFVDPRDPLFADIGAKYMREMSREFNYSIHIYNIDPFNEIATDEWSTVFVQLVARSLTDTLLSIDPDAVWLMQNWMFVHDPLLWPVSRVEAFLTSVPRGRLLILDLQSEQFPQYELYNMYYGHPYLWCMLHNFGGTLGMYGDMKAINTRVHLARRLPGSTLIGTGLTMEGINQNYVVYDLMLENSWRKEPHPDLEGWVEGYALRRYGTNATSRAWRYLIKSVYNYDRIDKIRGKYIITRMPSDTYTPWAWYTSHHLIEAFKEFIATGQDYGDAFRYDLVDLTRQLLQYRADQLYLKLIHTDTEPHKTKYAKLFLEIFDDLYDILSSHREFTAYNWFQLNQFSEAEKTLLRWNGLNQITLWGPNGEIEDYACKQWAELLLHYYKRRWNLFLNGVTDRELIRTIAFQELSQINFDDIATNKNPISVAHDIFKKWAYVPGLRDLSIEPPSEDTIPQLTLLPII